MVLLALGLALAAAVGGFALGRTTGHEKTVTVSGGGAVGIEAAPAFSADDLTAQPKENWLTNGGSTFNQRYSPLDEIDTSNVSQVKGIWHKHLKSGIAAKYSGEAQPIVYQGVMYVVSGNDDLFAVDVATGAIDWTYESGIDQKITTVCCGWTSRGVAIGDGRVYVGQLDGSLVALDMKTGEKEWATQIGRWQDGYTITSAPLYWNGRVYTGLSGGEFGARGRLTALDAETGDVAWRFFTTPGPGDVGHDTWPANSDAWEHGGATIWQTPAVDPELGLIYFSTSNASPDFDGAARAGDNLFTSSIVALDVDTGEYRWHFQEVHHDIWDYDAPSPVVLFDVDGDHGIAQVGKTGFAYILDRATGKPLVPIHERAVPQDASQATSPTQPFPEGDATVRQSISQAQFDKIKTGLPKGVTLRNGGKIFTPYGKGGPAISSPSALGGTNWFPTSYSPDTHLLYVCGDNSMQVFTGGNPTKYEAGKQFLGSAFAPVGTDTGVLTAIDVTTGRRAWQVQFPDRCYSGTVVTAGNIVFVGRSNGELEAYDAEKGGKALWSFQTGAGANNTPTVFEQDGKERIAFYAAGSALGASAHGDDLWLFGLDGTLTGTAKGQSGGGILHTGEKSGATASGANVFGDNCASCHGSLGQGGNGGPNLQTRPGAKVLKTVLAQVRNGGGGMPPFKDQLSDAEIKAVASYVTTRVASAGGK